MTGVIPAFEQWTKIHTLENRTLKEMFVAGYLTAREIMVTEYGDAALRRETEHPQDKITYDAEFAELGRKLDRILEILAPTAAQVLPPAGQEF